jgi:hypothetical protein
MLLLVLLAMVMLNYAFGLMNQPDTVLFALGLGLFMATPLLVSKLVEWTLKSPIKKEERHEKTEAV